VLPVVCKSVSDVAKIVVLIVRGSPAAVGLEKSIEGVAEKLE
jgi:hypothetical protein